MNKIMYKLDEIGIFVIDLTEYEMDSLVTLVDLHIGHMHMQCLKITQNVELEFFNLGIFHQCCPIKIDLSGNTV